MCAYMYVCTEREPADRLFVSHLRFLFERCYIVLQCNLEKGAFATHTLPSFYLSTRASYIHIYVLFLLSLCVKFLLSLCMYTYMYIHTYTCTNMCGILIIVMYIYIYVHTYMYIYKHTNMHTRMCTHIYIQIDDIYKIK